MPSSFTSPHLSFKPQAKMSKFILSSSGRTLGFKLGRSKHVHACESDSPLLFQERRVTVGPHKGCVEIFTEINGTEYYLDRFHDSKTKKPTSEVCLYKYVEGPAPKTNGRNLNQFWTKTAFEDGFILSPAAAPHQFVCFGEDGDLCLKDTDADLFHSAFVAEAPAAAPNPEPARAEEESRLCEEEIKYFGSIRLGGRLERVRAVREAKREVRESLSI